MKTIKMLQSKHFSYMIRNTARAPQLFKSPVYILKNMLTLTKKNKLQQKLTNLSHFRKGAQTVLNKIKER